MQERAKVLAANDHFVSDSMIDPNDGDAHSLINCVVYRICASNSPISEVVNGLGR